MVEPFLFQQSATGLFTPGLTLSAPMPTTTPNFNLSKQVDRVPSMRVPLDAVDERRFERLMDDLVLIDVHQHPMVLAEPATDMPAYFRGNSYLWGFEAAKPAAGRPYARPTCSRVSARSRMPPSATSTTWWTRSA